MRSGFTLFEIVFSIALFSILVALALPVGIDSYRHYLLTSEVGNFLNILRRAQALSFSNYNAAAHGIYVQAAQYTIFQGLNYATRNASYDEIYPRSTDISITGVSEIDFTAISGNSNTSSTLIFTNAVGSRAIPINDEGTINW